MPNHGTASEERVLEWALIVTRNAPRDLPSEVMDAWEKNGEVMKQRLREAFVSGPFVASVPSVVKPVLSFPPLQAVEEFEDWLMLVLELERACHLAFFGQEFDLTEFKATLKGYEPEKVKIWLALDLEPHFLPRVAMIRDANFPGWKVRPNDWYWQQLAAGKILRNHSGELVADELAELEGIAVLVDTRLKPKYKNGKQMWEGDTLLGSILIQLREESKIMKYDGTQDSRFGVSADEWEDEVKPVFAERICLPANQVLLEPVIVANAAPQIYSYMPRKDDGKTDTWVWYGEYFEDRFHRLYGGNSDDSGLVSVGCDGARFHWDDGSFRPLAVL